MLSIAYREVTGSYGSYLRKCLPDTQVRSTMVCLFIVLLSKIGVSLKKKNKQLLLPTTQSYKYFHFFIFKLFSNLCLQIKYSKFWTSFNSFLCFLVCISSSVISNSLQPHVVHLAPLSMEFSRQEYWSGLLFPSPGDLPNPGIKLESPALQTDRLFII